jgi:hypothetical protein
VKQQEKKKKIGIIHHLILPSRQTNQKPFVRFPPK